MGKTQQSVSQPEATNSSRIAANENSLDPTLASLFASSSGPVKVPTRVVNPKRSTANRPQVADNDEVPSGSDSLEDAGSDSETSDTSVGAEDGVAALTAAAEASERPRKRRRVADGDDLEASYFKRLEREEEKEQQRVSVKRQEHDAPLSSDDDNDEDAISSSGSEGPSASQSDSGAIPRHEVFDKKLNSEERLKRTVFLGNVSTEAIKSKSAKKTLTKHLRSVLKTPEQGKKLGKLESIRFRSTAYASDSGPKKATFAKKELMDETTTNTNAYAVFTTEAAAEHVAQKLNGTVVLDRHLRADYLGKPAQADHRRCVFIGNLSFVSKETAGQDEEDEDGSKKRRAAARQPADPEEGLWRTFSKAGKIESVRVVRDQETRISKGFAYVQFESENSVEGALLMHDKKFPPLLPRKLRVMRARRMQHKTPTAGPRSRSTAKGPAKGRGGTQGKGGFVFEGHRASSTSKGNTAGLKKRHKKRPTTRSSRRGAAFKAAGGNKSKPAGRS